MHICGLLPPQWGTNVLQCAYNVNVYPTIRLRSRQVWRSIHQNIQLPLEIFRTNGSRWADQSEIKPKTLLHSRKNLALIFTGSREGRVLFEFALHKVPTPRGRKFLGRKFLRLPFYLRHLLGYRYET
jgi:hypothetical protein